MRILTFLRYLQGVFNMNLTDSNRVHYAVIQSIYDEFIMAEGAMNASRLEMCLSTATGKWLDEWGTYFNCSRKLHESDDAFSRRIIKSVISPKATIPAIKDYVTDYLQDNYPEKEYTSADVIIKEPWKDVGKYSHYGTLSGTAIMSSDYYTHAVLDIRIPEEITRDVIDLVNAVKAAGVKILWAVYNTYEVVSGFNTAEDAWAAYHHQRKMEAKINSTRGMVLSGANPYGQMSGDKDIWFEVARGYEWYVKILMHNADESMVITKQDLLGLIDSYTVKETIQLPTDESLAVGSGDNALSVNATLSGAKALEKEIDRVIQIGEDTIEMLRALDDFATLSCNGRMSTETGVLFGYTAVVELYNHIRDALDKFRDEHPGYYESVQGPIQNGEHVMWYVARNKNWVWNTPLMSMDDFYRFWEPFNAEEHNINSIIDFEDCYYRGFITFGDKYQPPIVRGQPRRGLAGATDFLYLYDSQTMDVGDLQSIYAAKLERHGWKQTGDIDLRGAVDYESDGSPKPYSVIEHEQGPIEIESKFLFQARRHDCAEHD